MLYTSLEAWDTASRAERDDSARALARTLPEGFVYDGLERFALGDRAHEIAAYRTGTARFMLVPGGEVRLGFDPGGGWTPSPDMAASWDDSAAEYELPSLEEHLARILGPARTARVPPLLVEAEPWEVGWVEVESGSPEVAALTAAHPDAPQITAHRASGILRVTLRHGRPVRAERSDGTDQAGLAARLARDGWRLATPDEWEHLCSSGATTLFRWGDHGACDVYRTDLSAEEAAWRREAVLAGRRPTPPEGLFAGRFDAHRRPNAFGLSIAANPYHQELTAAPGVLRGGDGGVAICGGAGFLLGWLPLASAFRDPDICEVDPAEAVQPGYTIARRVRALDAG